MSPMHQAPAGNPTPQPPHSRRRRQPRQASRLGGRVYLKCSPWTVQRSSEGIMGILSGEIRVSHARHGDSIQTSASTAGICARGEPWREMLLSALLGTGANLHHHLLFIVISISSCHHFWAGDVPDRVSPAAVLCAEGLVLPSVAGTDCQPLSLLCKGVTWQVWHLCVMEMKIPACFFPSKKSIESSFLPA